MYKKSAGVKGMEHSTVTVMLTCFNRRNDTVNCIQSLVQGNPDIDFRFVITDDHSSDGTAETLGTLPYQITVLEGDGQLFWNGGMRMALQYALDSVDKTQYYMLVNDDVTFRSSAIVKMIERCIACPEEAVIVGATQDKDGNTSYGGVRLLSRHFAKFAIVEPSQKYEICDTFNGNCVLIPQKIFEQIGNLDPVYRHSMSDYDYGMHIRREGFLIYNTAEHVGMCNDNQVSGSWRDASLPRRQRLRKKESPKGLPRRDWYHFIRKNYGLGSAIYHSLTPYIRIVLGR